MGVMVDMQSQEEYTKMLELQVMKLTEELEKKEEEYTKMLELQVMKMTEEEEKYTKMLKLQVMKLTEELEKKEEEACCPICFVNPKNLAFGCGHRVCSDCGQILVTCPICRREIVTRTRLAEWKLH